MFFLLYPFFLFARFIFWALIVSSAVVLVVAFYAVAFLVTLVVYGVAKLIRAERRPPSPRKRPTPQAKYSNRR